MRVFDNPEYADRYTIVFEDKPIRNYIRLLKCEHYECISLSDNCDLPNGVAMWTDTAINPYIGREITFDELPENVQKKCREMMTEDE